MKSLLVSTLILSIVLSPLAGIADSKTERWEDRSTGAEQWFFHELPRHIGNDLKYTFWNGWHLLFLAGSAVTIAGVHESDPEIQRAFQPERPMGNTFDTAMKWGAHPLVLGGETLLALGISKLAGSKKAAATAGTMFEALVITETLTIGLQFATHRGRPDGSGHTSFPSGHTSGAFALATVTEVLYGPWYGVPAYVLAGLVGVSRIDSNRHVTTDVLAGAALGTLIGLGTAKFHKKKVFQNYFMLPTAGDGSAGVSLVHLF